MNNLTVDLTQVHQFALEGGQLVFTKDAEESLIKLLQLKEVIELEIERVKTAIGEAGQSIDPNFKGVIGEKVKASYRVFGEKYGYDESMIEDAQPYVNQKVTFKVDSKKVDEYYKKKGELPPGIVMRARSPTISLQPTEDGKEEIEAFIFTPKRLE